MRDRNLIIDLRRGLALIVLAAMTAAPAVTEEPPPGQFLESESRRIHFMDWGSGEPVLLIHGLTLDLDINWLQSGIAAALREAGFRVVAYDTRGHGKSLRPHDPESYGPDEVNDAMDLLDHLGIDRAHVVGWSRGGFLANRIAAWHSDRVLTLTLAGWGESGENGGAIPEAGRAQTAAILEAGDYHSMVRMVIPDGSPEEVERWATLLAERNDPSALAAVVRSGAAWPVLSEEELRSNQAPALAIIGDADFLSAEVTKMRAVMSGLEVLVLPGATHGTTLPRPEFVTALLGFLGKHRG